jgi:hypothetical protein
LLLVRDKIFKEGINEKYFIRLYAPFIGGIWSKEIDWCHKKQGHKPWN